MLQIRINPVDDNTATNFSISLERHVQYVKEAANILGIPKEWVVSHDDSKYEPVEFHAYARNFQGNKGDPDGFAVAWLHHIHSNPHHWQYFVFPDGYSFGTIKGVAPMPRRYYMEMIADWMGASKAYTGDWDMSGWLLRNLERIILHPETAQAVRNELDKLGYGDIVNTMVFKNEVSR